MLLDVEVAVVAAPTLLFFFLFPGWQTNSIAQKTKNVIMVVGSMNVPMEVQVGTEVGMVVLMRERTWVNKRKAMRSGTITLKRRR